MKSSDRRAGSGPCCRRRRLLGAAVGVFSLGLFAPGSARADVRVTHSVPPSTMRGRDSAGWVQVGPLFPQVSVEARPVGSVLELGSLRAASASFDVLGYRVERPRARLNAPVHAELGDDGVFRLAPRSIPVHMEAMLVPIWGGQSIPISVLGTNASVVIGRFDRGAGVVRMRGEFVHVPDSGPPLARAELDLHLGTPASGALGGRKTFTGA